MELYALSPLWRGRDLTVRVRGSAYGSISDESERAGSVLGW